VTEGASVVVITGAGSGIGRAVARRYARSGARLGLLDRDRAGVEAVAAELAQAGAETLARECDVTRWDDCKRAIEAVIDVFGGIDVLINNAGITHLSPVSATEIDVVRRVMDVNFFGALHCTKAALESLVARRGMVIAISSVAGFAPLSGRCAYAASKHALHGLFETLRSEQAANGLGVMMVCPGFTRTAIESSALAGDGGVLRGPRSVYGKQADPDRVAEAIYRAARRRRRLLVLSPVGKLSYVISRVWPALYERMMTRRMRVAPTAAGPQAS
jgi:NAD(P)-dependent dehydrogenase (short-subunit alcohol dehydrogenase family)